MDVAGDVDLKAGNIRPAQLASVAEIPSGLRYVSYPTVDRESRGGDQARALPIAMPRVAGSTIERRWSGSDPW
jgi:hypothetical protein